MSREEAQVVATTRHMDKKILAARKDQYELAKTNQEGSEGSGTEYRQQAASRRDCSTSRVWLVLAIFFFLTTLALGGYLIYVQILEKRQQTTFEENIIMNYPGYFRTPEEQSIFQEQYNQVAVTTSVSTVDNTTIRNNCTFSQHQFVSPVTAEDVDGNTVKILKLNNRAQYFLTEKCQHAEGCTGCTCGQRTTLIPAVITSPGSDGQSSVSIKLIKLPGCCRCLNGEVS